MNIGHFLLSILFILGIATYSFATFDSGSNLEDPYADKYVISQDTIPLQERYGDYINDQNYNPFDLNDPSSIEQNVEYDPETGYYIITEKIGDDYYRNPTYMTFGEYLEWSAEQQESQYFEQLGGFNDASGSESGLIDPIAKFDIKNSLIDRLFGGSTVDIRPQGEIGLTFGVDYQKVENPTLTLRQQRQGGFDFDMDIQMNVTGKIGEKLNLSMNYNTQATFDFDNQMKIQYDSEAFSDDDIIKKIEAGNVSLPLKGSLIQGSQSLFGIKAELQFGKLYLTMIASQQKSRRQNIEIEGGAQVQQFEVRADEYDENRHFFLSHYNRGVFEESLKNLPQVDNLFKIKRIEVWITNDRNDPDNVRDIVALSDIGESAKITNNNPLFQLPPSPMYPDIYGERGLPGFPTRDFDLPQDIIDANNLYVAILNNSQVRDIDKSVSVLQNVMGLQQSKDFEKVRARQLSSNEFIVNEDLGFISLNVNVQPDQVLGVAYEYDYNGKTYKVGEFANDTYSPDSLGVMFVRMLKSTTQRIDLPDWDLMMKNVYSIGAFQVNQEDFRLDIFYDDPGKGLKRFLPDSEIAGKPLLTVFNLDNLNVQGDPCPDGVFDFVPGITINPRNGRIMFPVLEPFSTAITDNISNPTLQDKYNYFVLYDSTITRAREYQELNRYIIKGNYKSSVSSEFSLGSFNLPEGSVIVTAGGQTLQEGKDYEVDYSTGRLRVLNDAYLNSGLPINISFEDNTLFGFQTKALLGARADYEINKNFNVGATFLNLYERPFTQKVNIGDDPVNNRIYGFDVNYSNEALWLTKAVNALPGLSTKAPSNITISAEAAYLDPGHSKAINQGLNEKGKIDKSGVVYIDDFEGSASSFDLRIPSTKWALASVPQNDEFDNNPLFPESNLINDLRYGTNRARLNWYRIDQAVQGGNGLNNYTAPIPLVEVFPNLQTPPGQSNLIQTFDMTYYPEERGPYNFDVPGGTEYSAGLSNSGKLLQPDTRWGGIMRDLTTNDFQAANIVYIDFWLLDPFLDDAGNNGDMYINLGSVSEDILRDSRKFFENGLPTDNNTQVDESKWGRIPRAPAITNAFTNGTGLRELQDVGLDGLNDSMELAHYNIYIDEILDAFNNGILSQAAKDTILADPSRDNYKYFLDYPDSATILEKYSKFNNPQGNTPNATGNQRSSATNLPDSEDLNQDNTLSESESYFQYKIELKDENLDNRLDYENNPYVTSVVTSTTSNRVWYNFKIPIDSYDSKIGSIQDFRSIRFMRMYLKEFENQVTLRFARLELTRNQWRRFERSLLIYQDPNLEIDTEELDNEEPIVFDVNTVNIEENSEKIPFSYTLPPDIQREQSTNATYPDILQNEQSLAVNICNLPSGSGRAVYNNRQLDLRVYEQIRMFVHAEAVNEFNDLDAIDDGDLSIFLRIGSDFQENYYEYEIPLVMSRDNTLGYLDPAYKYEVWPVLNNFDISIRKLVDLKKLRNENLGNGAALNKPFEIEDIVYFDNIERVGKMRIKGNPSLGYVKGVMMGIANRSDERQCFEIWMNELRLSGLDERGGFAAIGKIDATLADFGAATIAGNYSSIGFGSLEDGVHERSREEVIQFDLATNLELGNFLPESTGIKIPFYAQYSQTVRLPEFDPYDLDIPLKEKLKEENNKAERDSIREQAIDYTQIKGYNFTNVRKERTGKKAGKTPMPWDIENFSTTFAYTKITHHDPIIELDEIKKYNGSLDYNFSVRPKYITPLKKVVKNDKYLKFFTEFNFNPIPNSFSFYTLLNRQIQKTKFRFTDDTPLYSVYFNKQFTWDRRYDLQWDLAKSLKFSFNALNIAVIDELKQFDPVTGDPTPDSEIKQYLWDNIKDFGRTKNYNHAFNVNWTLPIKLIPFLDFVSVKALYHGDYNWSAASLNTLYLGNVIQNGQRRQLNGDLNFETLYNKSKYLKKINSSKRRKTRDNQRGNNKLNSGNDDKNSNDSGSNSRRKNDKNDKSATSGKSGTEEGGNNDPDTGGKGNKKKEKRAKGGDPSGFARAAIRPLLMLRKVRASYAENFSTIIPGYLPETEILGMSPGFGSPGWDFVAGWQPDIRNTDFENDWLTRAANKGWMTSSVFLNKEVQQNYTQAFDTRITIEPYSDWEIILNATKTYTENRSLSFKDTLLDVESEIRHHLPRQIGSFTISYFAMNTIFDNDITGLFQRFEDNRPIISQRIGESPLPHEIDGPDYKQGYGRAQQDVLMPAFLAAYTNKDANTVKVANDYTQVLFKELPRINWEVKYEGLAKLPRFSSIFSRFSISHGYQSTLTVNSYNTNISYESPEMTRNQDLNFSYKSRFEIPAIVITEQFVPLLGIRMELRSGLAMDLEFKKSRLLSMSFITYQLSETKTSEYVVGFGYRMKNVVIGFLQFNKKKKSKRKNKKEPVGAKAEEGSDLNIEFDFSLRDDITINHLLDQNVAEPTRGLRQIQISPSIDYNITKQLNLRLFYDFSRTTPKTSASFPITTSRGGIKITFSLN